MYVVLPTIAYVSTAFPTQYAKTIMGYTKAMQARTCSAQFSAGLKVKQIDRCCTAARVAQLAWWLRGCTVSVVDLQVRSNPAWYAELLLIVQIDYKEDISQSLRDFSYFQSQVSALQPCSLDTIQDFLCMLSMKPFTI